MSTITTKSTKGTKDSFGMIGVRWFGLAALVALTPLSAHQTTQTSSIEGLVIDAMTSRPVRGAVVRTNTRSAFRTGQDGRFVFRVAAGIITLSATKAGYLDGEAAPIEIVAGVERRDIVVRLSPEGLISGRVVDQFGSPVAQVTVRSEARAETARDESALSVVTDDLGQYTIGGLAKGEYIVGVQGGAGLRSSSPVFFPATPSRADAATIQVAAGVEQRGIDFQLHLDAIPPGILNERLLSRSPTAGAVAGVVRDRLGRGLARAVVMLGEYVVQMEYFRGTMVTTTTDESGRYEFANLAPGRLTLMATRPDCPLGALVSTKATVVQLDSSQRRGDVTMTLPDAGMLSGTLTDEFGDPHVGSVYLSEWSSWSTGPPVRTDPRGRFRFGCVPPGDYRLTVDSGPSGGDLRMWSRNGMEQTVAMMPVYYPGVSDPSLAAPVSVRAGADSGGFTVVVRPEPVTTIDVTVDSGGREISNLRVMRASLDDRWDDALRTSNDGRQLDSVPAGRFMLVADGDVQQGSAPVRLSATHEISSDGVTPLSVTLTLQPGGRISGRLVFEGTTRPPTSLGAVLIPIGAAAIRTLTGTQRNPIFNGPEFSIADVLPGRYLLRVSQIYPSSSWMLKSITMGGQHILDLPIEVTSGSDFDNVIVTFTDRVTEISGTVTDPAGRPMVLESVVAFPADSRHWRHPSLLAKHTLTDTFGRFVIAGLPPGDYRVAVSPMRDGSASPSMFAKLLPLSVPVVIAPGDRKIVNLTR